MPAKGLITGLLLKTGTSTGTVKDSTVANGKGGPGGSGGAGNPGATGIAQPMYDAGP